MCGTKKNGLWHERVMVGTISYIVTSMESETGLSQSICLFTASCVKVVCNTVFKGEKHFFDMYVAVTYHIWRIELVLFSSS